MEANIFLGIALHAVGGIAAASCFVPQKGTSRWQFQNFWLLMCLAAWLIVPVIVASLTVPNLWGVIAGTEGKVLLKVTLLGAVYGFGGMAFGVAIRHIGYSLTYAVAIGISAVLGTILPLLQTGTLLQTFSVPGGSMIVTAGFMALGGIVLCGIAGKMKESQLAGSEVHFNAKLGLTLVVLAGVLSAVFGLSLAAGEPMDKLATAHGAGQFAAGAKYIFAMGGALITNLVWWGVVHTRCGTWKDYKRLDTARNTRGGGGLASHYLFALFAGLLWYGQFFFYGLGHTRMGNYGFISWGVHMAMLIFFSFIIGLILKEWKGLKSSTLAMLAAGLTVLLTSFALIVYGSYQGEQASKTEQQAPGH
ncbi:MAG: rhamnose:proton symporter [Akkermansiaceae bacterium]|nr:rhamnose:proton symporter [Akkermansiaceae bacterium]